MTDFNTGGDEPVVSPSADPGAPVSDTVSRAEYEALQKENATYRQRFQPIERAFSDLDPADAQNFLGFVDAYKSGDSELAGKWLLDSAQAVNPTLYQSLIRGGASPVEAAAEVQAEQVAQANPTLTADQVDQIVASKLQEYQQGQILQASMAEVRAMGYEPTSPLAASIFAYATDNRVSLAEARTAVEEEIVTRSAAISQARAQAASGQPSPNGQPAINHDPNMSTRDQMRAAMGGFLKG